MTRFRWWGLVLALFTLAVLWTQAMQPTWNSHAQIDIWVFWERLNYWLNHGHSFWGLTGNEILPMTLVYMFIPAGLIPPQILEYNNYYPAMLAINMIVLIGHYFVTKDKMILSLCLLAFGPVLLFRFDPTVMLLVLLSFDAFTKLRYPLSGFWMGLAVGMKVFPVIVIPYMILILLKRKQTKQMLAFLIFFAEAMLIPVMIFLLLGGSLPQIWSALAFHSQKLISIESVPGSFITLQTLITSGHPPALLPGNGIWAVPGPAVMLNKLWMIPVGAVYIYIWLKKQLWREFDIRIPFVLILIFLVFSKNLNPQYMWWFMALLPLVKPGKLITTLVLVAAVLNQLVFPIFYTLFVDNFFQQNESYWIYFVLLARNVLIVVVTYLSTTRLVASTTKAEG